MRQYSFLRVVCWFPIAAVTVCYKLSDWKHELFILYFSGSKVSAGPHWAKSKVPELLSFLVSLGMSRFPCRDKFLRPPGLWPPLAAQQRCVSLPLLFFNHTWESFPAFKYTHDQIGPSWIIWDTLPISRALIESHLQSASAM